MNIKKRKVLILATLTVISACYLALPYIQEKFIMILLGEEKIDPSMITFWVVAGLAGIMTLRSFVLSTKIRSLKKNLSVEEKEKDAQIYDLRSRANSLQDELIKTKKELAKAQNEIGELKDIETRINTEIRQLKESLEKISKERALLNKDNAAQKESIFSQQKELEKINIQRSELQNLLKEKEQLIKTLKDTNQDLTIEIQELKSYTANLQQEKETNQETITRQREELRQIENHYSELQDAFKELQDTNQRTAVKIQELESCLKVSEEENETKQATISQQREEIEKVLNQNTELNDALQEKEQNLRKLVNNNHGMEAKIQELESSNKGLNHKIVPQQQTIARQEQELEQITAQHSELKKTLREKEQSIKKLQSTNQDMAEKIQEIESNIAKLEHEKEINQENISSQGEELKRIGANYSELENTLNEKEQLMKSLMDTNQDMDAKIKEAQAKIKKLEEEKQAQAVIIAGLKKECEIKNNQSVKDGATEDKKNNLMEEKKNKEAKLAEVLLENKWITEASLEKALELQNKYGGNLLQFLLVNRDINENQLTECLSDKFKFPYLPLGTYEIPDEILELVPYSLVEQYWILPVDKIENNLMVVMVDPFDNMVIKEIEKITGSTVKVYVSLLSEIAEKIQRFYKVNIRGVDKEGNPASPIFIKAGDTKGRERRRAVRFKAELPLKVSYDGCAATSTTEDICWDGLSFKLDRELPICSTVTIELSMTGFEDEKNKQSPVTAVAEVRRATPLENNNFMIGVKLIQIPKDDISAIIKQVSEEQKGKESELVNRMRDI